MNNGLLNANLFNQTKITTTSVEDVSFNGYGLYNTNTIVLGVTRDYNTIDYDTFQIPQQDGNGYINSLNRGIVFSANFAIKGEDQNEVDTLYDEMLIKLSYKQGVFKYKPCEGTFREIIATMVGVTTTERTSKYILGTITFNSTEPYWKDSVLNSTLVSGIILSPATVQISNTGVNSLGQIFLLFGTGNSGVTSVNMTCNDRIINFSGNINDGDILLIDNENKQVLLNNIIQDYDGTFCSFINGVNSLIFTINGTINLDVSVIYPTNNLLP